MSTAPGATVGSVVSVKALAATVVARLDLSALAETARIPRDQLQPRLMPDGRVVIQRLSTRELVIVDWDGVVSETIALPAEISNSMRLESVQTTGVATFVDASESLRSWFVSLVGNSKGRYLGWLNDAGSDGEGEASDLVAGVVELHQHWESVLPIAAPGSNVVALGSTPPAAAELEYPEEWFGDAAGNVGALDVDPQTEVWKFVTVNPAGHRREIKIDKFDSVLIQADHAFVMNAIDSRQLLITELK